MAEVTLCWSCARATGACSWSERLVPVKGWVAIKIERNRQYPYGSYVVKECPGYIMDSYNDGLKRITRKENKDDYYSE